jgi:hypothetical protein
LDDENLLIPKPARLRSWHAKGVKLYATATAMATSGPFDDTSQNLTNEHACANEARLVSVTTLLRLDITGSHWCQRIGRHHRSNHVTWFINLQQHTAWQTCLDVDCRSLKYVSPFYPLPPELMPNQWPTGFTLVPVNNIASGHEESKNSSLLSPSLPKKQRDVADDVNDEELCAFLDVHEAEILEQLAAGST